MKLPHTIDALLKKQREMQDSLHEIQTAINEQRSAAVAQLRTSLIEQAAAYGFTAADVFGQPSHGPSHNQPASPKKVKRKPAYRDPATGETWSGSGYLPVWVRAHLPPELAANNALQKEVWAPLITHLRIDQE